MSSKTEIVSDPISSLIPGNTMNEVAFNANGSIVGERDGSRVWNEEGGWLCNPDGDWLSKTDGEWLLRIVGSILGSEDGDCVSSKEGALLSETLGCEEGLWLSSTVDGCEVGVFDGILLGLLDDNSQILERGVGSMFLTVTFFHTTVTRK